MNDKNSKMLERVKCCIPYCDEEPMMVSIPIKGIHINNRFFEYGKTIPMCFRHMSYFRAGKISFKYEEDIDKLKVFWSEDVNMMIEEKKELLKKHG